MKTLTRFMYVRDNARNPVGCIAMTIDGDKVTYGTSLVHPSDMKLFTKKAARELANENLKAHPKTVSITRDDKTTTHTITRDFLNHLSTAHESPSKLRKFAKTWVTNSKVEKTVTEKVIEKAKKFSNKGLKIYDKLVAKAGNAVEVLKK